MNILLTLIHQAGKFGLTLKNYEELKKKEYCERNLAERGGMVRLLA